MNDWIVIACTVACFIAAFLYVRACRALKGGS